MKRISTYMTSLAAASFVMALAVPSHASFSSKGTSLVSASATIGGTPTIAISGVQVLNLSNGQAASGLAWSGVTAGYATNGGWKVSDQYIQMTANINTTSGGIQIYTDNTNAAAAHKFTGPNDGVGNDPTPAGLVDNTDTTRKLATAWTASTATYAAGAASLAPVDPAANAGNSYSWFYHEDAHQVANANIGATAFANGSSYVTVYAAPSTLLTGESIPVTGGGVHYAQGVSGGAQQFGPFTIGTSVTNIYTEANFLNSLAGRTYSTDHLVLEAYSL